MNVPQRNLVAALALSIGIAIGGCVGSEATFPGDGGGDSAASTVDASGMIGTDGGGSKPPGDSSTGPETGSTSPESGTDGATNTMGDAGDGGGGPPPPPPVAGKPGFDVTAGGNVSKSTSYKLIGAVGEPPGGNKVSKSTSYTLKGGVVAGTQ